MVEILWNERIGDYSFREEIDGVKSIKRVPIKFKFNDKTARFRKKFLRENLIK